LQQTPQSNRSKKTWLRKVREKSGRSSRSFDTIIHIRIRSGMLHIVLYCLRPGTSAGRGDASQRPEAPARRDRARRARRGGERERERALRSPAGPHASGGRDGRSSSWNTWWCPDTAADTFWESNSGITEAFIFLYYVKWWSNSRS